MSFIILEGAERGRGVDPCQPSAQTGTGEGKGGPQRGPERTEAGDPVGPHRHRDSAGHQYPRGDCGGDDP